jgi:hypothetical protein
LTNELADRRRAGVDAAAVRLTIAADAT